MPKDLLIHNWSFETLHIDIRAYFKKFSGLHKGTHVVSDGSPDGVQGVKDEGRSSTQAENCTKLINLQQIFSRSRIIIIIIIIIIILYPR